MILAIEIIAACLLFTVTTIAGTKKDPLSGLHNMPIPLQERVASMPQYAGVKVVHTRERILKKVPVILIFLLLFVWMMRLAGARSFAQGFGYTFLLWLILKLYVVFVLECGWYAHTPSAWIPGTEDTPEYYQNYLFYISSIPRSLLVGAILALPVGVLCAVL